MKNLITTVLETMVGGCLSEESPPETYNDIRLVQCFKTQADITKALLARKELSLSNTSLILTELDDKENSGIKSMMVGTQTILDENLNKGKYSKIEKPEVLEDIKSGEEQVISLMEVPKVKGTAQIPRVERRASARLRRDLILSTEDKNMMMSKKRNLEGTNLNNENSFSVLTDNDIMKLSKDMGITIDDSNFAAIDLVKELEIARHSLAEKKIAPIESTSIIESIIEVVEEEIYEVESLIIHSQKRKGKPKNRLSLSGPRKNKKKGKENPYSRKSKDDGQGNHDLTMDTTNKKGVKKKK